MPDESVKVVVRVRPLSRKEIQDGHEACTVADESRGIVTVANPRGDEGDPPKTFTFDAVFDPDVTQRKLYDVCSAPVVEAVLSGFNGTIFAYGQTGAGKTFTMEGSQEPPELRGIIPNAFQQIFDKVALAQGTQQFLVRASYLEIYNEEIRDLLAKDPKNKLELKENVDSGVYVRDLTSFIVKSSHEIDQVMQAGKKNRSVGATLMNQGSSRSHAIFTIIVECCETTTTTTGGREGEGSHIHVGKLNLVDLAGSERQSKTGATGDRLKEATKINLSLSALGNVISALVDGKSQHIPYRDSKLTRLLQDSLGGNTKTVMCANCGPAGYNYDETVSTLRYANRAKNIKNKPRINEDPKDAMLREFTEEIARLKAQLAAGGALSPGASIEEEGLSHISRHDNIVEVEKIVEKEVLKEVRLGVSEEELERIQLEAEEEKARIKEEADAQLARLLEERAESDDAREKLRAEIVRQETERKRASERKKQVLQKIQGMQAKLLVGGQMLDEAAKQEAELRRARQTLQEKETQERALAQELAAQEAAREDLGDKYNSIDEEVEKKSRKLEKLVKKLNAAEAEVADLQREFQREREDMLDTIRQLARQIKLKDTVVELFVPSDRASALEARAKWSEESDTWTLRAYKQQADLEKRPLSAPHLKRPETEYARHRKQYDPNPRYKDQNIAALELDTHTGISTSTTLERTNDSDKNSSYVVDSAEEDMRRSKLESILASPIDEQDAQIVVPLCNGVQTPIEREGREEEESTVQKNQQSQERRSVKSSRASSSSGAKSARSRPKSAHRRRSSS